MKRIPLVAFTIAGPMAHFRKFYTTTSALTYLFPPRTTLMGLVAGMLGFERDNYYEKLSSRKLWVAVRMLTPVRKRTFTLNYLFTKDNKLYERGQGTQIPVEWVLAKPPYRIVRYRVYLSSPDEILMEKIVDRFKKQNFIWPVYLGVSEALGWIEDIWIGETLWGEQINAVPLGTPIIHTQDISLKIEEGLRLFLDRITQDFRVKPYRSPVRTIVLIFEANGKPFIVQVPYPVFELPDFSGVFGSFMHEISFSSG